MRLPIWGLEESKVKRKKKFEYWLLDDNDQRVKARFGWDTQAGPDHDAYLVLFTELNHIIYRRQSQLEFNEE